MCFIAILANSLQMNGLTANAFSNSQQDDKLKECGTPESVLETMDSHFKEFIRQNIKENEQFESYSGEEPLDQNTNKKFGISTYANTTPMKKGNITVTIYRTKVNNSKHSYYYKIYPYFKWNVPSAVKNDGFAIALYSGWHCDTKVSPQLIMKAYSGKGDLISSSVRAYSSTEAAENGYGFHIPTSYGIAVPPFNGHYEGYTYFYAWKDEKSCEDKASIEYVHNASANYNYSFGFNIGYVSIGISTNVPEKLVVYADNIEMKASTK